MNLRRRSFWGLGVLLLSLLFAGNLRSDQQGNKFEWIVFPPPASSQGADGSSIQIAGTGTFVVGESEEVTGGGDWTTVDSMGATTGSGKFKVTRLVKFDVAPGTDPTAPSLRGGLAFLRVTYSDGTKGVLVVSCNLGPTINPASVAEGFTASKGFTNYWNGFTGFAVFVAQSSGGS